MIKCIKMWLPWFTLFDLSSRLWVGRRIFRHGQRALGQERARVKVMFWNAHTQKVHHDSHLSVTSVRLKLWIKLYHFSVAAEVQIWLRFSISETRLFQIPIQLKQNEFYNYYRCWNDLLKFILSVLCNPVFIHGGFFQLSSIELKDHGTRKASARCRRVCW